MGITLTKPVGGEVWASGGIQQVSWTSNGSRYWPGSGQGVADIIFSKDGGANWRTIQSLDIKAGSYQWHLPDIVDSSQCIVSVIPGDGDSNVVSTQSGQFTIHPGSADPVIESKWKSLGGDLSRSGLSKYFGPRLGCVKWQFETDGPVSASVTIGAEDRVHIASEDGKLYTLDVNGVLLWTYDANSPLISSPAVGVDGTVYVGSMDGKAHAVDINGNLRWNHMTDGFIYSSAAVSADGKIYICSQDGTLYALSHDGSSLWSFKTDGFGVLGGSILASPAVGADGTVYIGGLYDPNLYALDPNDGTVKWVCNFESGGWPFTSPVIADDGTIYQTLLYDPNLYAIDSNNGNIIWTPVVVEDIPEDSRGGISTEGILLSPFNNTSDHGMSEPVLGPDGTIYVNFNDPNLWAIDSYGNVEWVIRLGVVGGFTLTVDNSGLIYAASDDGQLYVVNSGGDLIARFEGDSWLSFPVVTANNAIIVNDANNTVWQLGGDDCHGQASVLHRLEDLSMDTAVNFADWALLIADWMDCSDDTELCGYYQVDRLYLRGDINMDMYVNFEDARLLAEQWLIED